MPIGKRSIFFRYFDKAALGLTVLGLIASLGYPVVRRGAVGQYTGLAPAIEKDIRVITEAQKRPEPDPPQKDFLTGAWQSMVANLTAEIPVEPYRFRKPRPVEPEAMKVGVDRDDIVISFGAPLDEGSIRVESGLEGTVEEVVRVVEHPYQGDYSKVRIRTIDFPGDRPVTATIEGRAGQVPYWQMVIVDKGVGKVPYPPVELAASVSREGVNVSFEEAPEIETDEVIVAYYEIERRDWSDPLGEFERVCNIDPEGRVIWSVETKEAVRRPIYEEEEEEEYDDRPPEWVEEEEELPDEYFYGQPGYRSGRTEEQEDYYNRPRDRQAGELPPEEEVVPAISWLDGSVAPGGRYSYRVRTVGENTFPEKGETFAQSEQVEAPPDIDIMLVSVFQGGFGRPARARLQIVMLSGASGYRYVRNIVAERTVDVRPGDMIGDVIYDEATGRQLADLSTGYTLVDCQPYVRRIKDGLPQVSARIIYADRDGVLRGLWKGDRRTELWDLGERRMTRSRRFP